MRSVVPEPMPGHVVRPRLLQRLGRPGAVPLVVVTGPPGSGKSALVAQWLQDADDRTRTGWITFADDQRDFWGSVTRCLTDLGLDMSADPPGAGPGQPDAAHVADAAPPALAEDRYLIVLDGLELTSGRLARQADFVLRKFHRRLTFAITSRVDPVLPLSWYRDRHWSIEIREADLRCTVEETAGVLRAAGVPVTTAQAAALTSRVSGWLGGVVMAAHAVRATPGAGHDLSAEDVAAGAGSLQEYLLRKVLERHDEAERETLLLASVVEDLVPGLAERVTGSDLDVLAARLTGFSMFCETSTAGDRGWRLQPMMRDLLRAQLAFESPSAWEQANRRAASWYRDHGRMEPAIAHLVAIDAWREVADLLVESLQVPRIASGVADGVTVDIARRLPDDLTSPGTRLVRAALRLADGREQLAAAELAQPDPAQGQRLRHADETRAALHAWCAARLADTMTAGKAVAAAESAVAGMDRVDQVLEIHHPGRAVLRALTSLAEGYLCMRTARLEAGAVSMRNAFDRAPEDALRLRVLASGYEGLASALVGRLSDAGAAAARAVSLLEESSTPRGRRCPVPYLTLAYVALQRGDRTAAGRHRDRAEEAHGADAGPVERAVAALVRAGVLADGDAGAGTTTFLRRAADDLSSSPALADLLRIEAARMSLPGDPRQAVGDLDALHDPERPPAVVARAAALRRTDPRRASELLEGMTRAPRSPQTEVERLVAAAELELDRSAISGRRRLDEALTLAAPENLHRPFDKVAPTVEHLLHTDTTLRAHHPWLVKTHQQRRSDGVPRVADDGPRDPGAHAADGDGPSITPPRCRGPGGAAPLVEPLTAKEMEVLTHLNRLFDTEEIAAEMVVSVNTVRTHVRHVLRKLGVDRRNAAVRRAWELGLLPGPDDR
jgi:LuxR family maltose regulon positive regulatory protein